jgi:ribosomal protein S18 acetylase RimI-like enzyme
MEVTLADVTEVRRAHFAPAAGVLARAFDDTEQWRRAIPNDDIRLTKLTQMFHGTMKTTVAAKGLLEQTPHTEAVAIWLPPGRSMGLWSMVRSGFASAGFAVRPPRLSVRSLMRMLNQFEHEHKAHMPDPHWYLMALGVDPEHQRQGYGSTLVRHGLERSKAEGIPLYLETESGPNVDFYSGLGLKVIDEVTIEEIDLPFALMVSEA